MTLPAPTYDLMLLLDPQTEDSARAKIVSDAVSTIEAQGQLVRQDEWGERQLAYPIDRKSSADYHLLQFHVGETALIEGLDRTLRITDGVLRHRIIKLAPGTSEPPRAGAPRAAELGEEPAAEHAAAETAPAETAHVEATPAGTAPAGTAPAGTAPAGTAPAGTAPAETAPSEAAPAPAEPAADPS